MPQRRLFLWPGQALVINTAADSRRHAHRALQLSLAPRGRFLIKRGQGDWQSVAGAVTLAGEIHQINSEGAALAHLFLDPEIAALGHAEPNAARIADPGLHAELSEALLALSVDAPDSARALSQRWLSAWLDFVPPRTRDERIAALLIEAERDPGEVGNTQRMADRLGLSRSQFMRLMREQVGLSWSRYRHWLRLLALTRFIVDGHSLTEAAHRFGFSDSAHLTRVFAQTFGVVPSQLLSLR